MKKIFASAAIAAAIAGGALAGASPASAANGINGNVSCVKGKSVTKPVGVWADYDDTKGKYKKGTWTTLWSNGPNATFAQIAYSAPVEVKTFHLHIGCGGDSKKWGTTVYIDKAPGNFGSLKANW